MADTVVRDLLTEFETMKADRLPVEATWDEIAEYVVPHRSGYGAEHDPEVERGERRGSVIYDGTAQSALNLYASGTMGYLLSSSFNWFSSRVPDEKLMDNREVRLWLSQVDAVLFGMLTRSNFYREARSLFTDGGSVGTAPFYRYWDAMTAREVFMALHPREIFVAEDAHGEVDTVFRYTQMTARQLLQRFKDANLNDEIRAEAADPQTAHKLHRILHAMKPNPRFDPRKRDSKARKVASWYVDVEHEGMIRQRGFDILPVAVWRVQKESDERYGRGPGWAALADIKQLQEYARTDITAAQMLVQPPIDIPEERRGDVQYIPGGRSYYDEAGRPVRRLVDDRVELRAGLDREERKQQLIREHYMVDFFLMFAQAEREMTATEIRQRREEKAVLLGPHITGLNQDILDKVIDGLFNDAWNAGMIPPPPEILVKSGNGRLEIDYQGPLAQAQRSYFQGQPYREALQTWMALTELHVNAGRRPDFLDNYNFDFVSKEMVKAGGFPEEAIIDERQVAEMRKQRADAEAKQQRMAAMEQMGKAAKGMNEPVQEGSLMEAAAG